jgi:hypothetical protein
MNFKNCKDMETSIKKPNNKAVGRMTERQIKRKVGEAWALLENPVYSEKGVMLSAELLYYDADKAKVRKKMREQFGTRENGGHFALYYYGTPDPNVVYIL